MKLFLLILFALAMLTLPLVFLAGCAVDYETKAGDKFRFSVTATPQEVADALEGWRK